MKTVQWLQRIVYTLLAVLVTCTGGCRSTQPSPRATPYIIAYPKTWSQIQLYGSDQNLTGFTSDLLYEIAQAGHFQIQLVMGDASSFQTLLDNNTIDAVITSIPIDSISQKVYSFSSSYFVTGTVVVASVLSPFEKIEDLVNVRIGYGRDDETDIILGANSSWQLIPYENSTLALDDLVSEKLDGVIINLTNANRLIKNLYRSRIKVLLPPLVTKCARLAVLKGKNEELIQLFNKGFEQYVKSGQYEELLKYWSLESQVQLEKSRRQSQFIPYR